MRFSNEKSSTFQDSAPLSMESLKEKLLFQGWIKVSAPHQDPIFEVREIIEDELKRYTGEQKITLEHYGDLSLSEDAHLACHQQMAKFFRQKKLGRKVIEANLAFFIELIGPDLDVQSHPYLRIARPQVANDNLDFHRDTFYGHTPYELSVLVPYVSLPKESSLSVLSGSHTKPDRDFPFIQFRNPEVEKGSIKNQLGFLYAPKRISIELTDGAEPVPLRLGEMLIFSQATIHGSRINSGKSTRWSSDTRVVNAFIPLRSELKSGYYEPLHRSVISQFAQRYYSEESIGASE